MEGSECVGVVEGKDAGRVMGGVSGVGFCGSGFEALFCFVLVRFFGGGGSSCGFWKDGEGLCEGLLLGRSGGDEIGLTS